MFQYSAVCFSFDNLLKWSCLQGTVAGTDIINNVINSKWYSQTLNERTSLICQFYSGFKTKLGQIPKVFTIGRSVGGENGTFSIELEKLINFNEKKIK